MKVLFVSTCDGPVLFKLSSRRAAVELARQQVMYNDLDSYDSETRSEVSLAWSSHGKTGNLFEKLEECGAIRVEEVR